MRKIPTVALALAIVPFAARADDKAKEAYRLDVPMQRMGRPEEVAAVVSFLCSAEAGYVTRQVISVNGGML